MIELRRVTFRYDENLAPVLNDVTFTIPDGELALVIGPTGAGKSTLLGLLNGLVPHFSGGTLTGSVIVDGIRTADHPPREFASTVGVAGQDPLAGFVTDTVEEELAYGLEQLGVAAATMRKRVEETLDLLGIADLRGRALRTLSGGQQQRVAIGSVLAAGPRVLVLDEPTSALDPTSAEEVIAAVVRLVHDLGMTVVMAEHRLERVLQYADRVLLVRGDGTVEDGDPRAMMAASPLVPPLVELARVVGWQPIPLSIRDARRLAGPLRGWLPAPAELAVNGPELLQAKSISVHYGSTVAVDEVTLSVARGEIAALMGRNGSGKSSLLWALTGVGKLTAGAVTVAGTGRVAMVPQTAADLLYLGSVDAECTAADQQHGRSAGSCRAMLDRLTPDVDNGRHPRDLSEGQRLSLVLAIQLTGSPDLVLLDEPTRGLDYRAKAQLIIALKALAAEGTALIVATHDVEFVAQLASRVIVLAQGEVVADGPVAEVVAGSPTFAPQVAKVLYPQPWLTVEQVRNALAADHD